jgi:hypothetical protein
LPSVSTDGLIDRGEASTSVGFNPFTGIIRGLKPTEEPALKPEIINRQLKHDGKKQACGHSLRSLKEREYE